MTDLADTFGEDFAEHVQKKTAERRQERNRISEEQLARVCSLAINEGKFKEGDPQFQYTTDNGIDHDVLLMQVPNPDRGEVWEHLSEPWDGAAKLPLEYLGQWYWSVFPDKTDVRKLDQGDWCIVVGAVEESENDKGDTFYNIYPVRGIATLEEAKELAEADLDAEFGDEEEESEEEEDFAEPEEEDDDTSGDVFGSSGSDDEEEDDEEEEDSSSGGSSSGGGVSALLEDDDDDEEEEEEEPVADMDDVRGIVEKLADKQDEDEEPQVFEIDEGSEFHGKITKLVGNKLDVEEDDLEDLQDMVWLVIEENQEEEEEEDDDMNKLF